MHHDSKYQLEDLIFDLTEIPASDILVHVDLAKRGIVEIPAQDLQQLQFPLDPQWNALLKTTVQNKRQSDTETLCLAIDGMEWDYKGKKVVSPLWLVPVSYKINKVKQQIELIPDLENILFNPFVKNELKRRYELIWQENTETLFSQKSTEFYEFLEQNELPFLAYRFSAFGNFHHHRFQIVKDLEALTRIELNSLVNEMLGNSVIAEKNIGLNLTRQNIVSADKDQKTVFNKIQSGNLVIQGPPGTGKSQVLTNVLAKLLEKGNMNLVVSEKKAALEVLVKKLAVHGLDAFTFISHSQNKPSDFISRLRETWNLLENNSGHPEKNLLLSEQLVDQLQMKLDKLVSKELIGGISLSQFKGLLKNQDLSTVPYSSHVPLVSEWLQEKEKIQHLSQEISSFQILKNFKQKGLSEAIQLDRILKQLKDEFITFTEKLQFKTFAELEIRISQVARCQILENESYRKYTKLFTDKKLRKKFEKLRINFLQQQEAFRLVQPEAAIWKEKPTLSQAQSWQLQFAENWWKKRKAEKQVRNALVSNTIIPAVAVENWLLHLKQENELQQTIATLQELGIERPELELESIHYLWNQLEKEDANELNQVAALNSTLRKELLETGSKLQQTCRNLKTILHYDLHDPILQAIENAIQNLPEIIQVQQMLQAITPSIYQLLQQFNSPEEIEKLVLKSNWIQFESHFPELAKWNGNELQSFIEKIIQTQSEENTIFGKTLVFKQHQKFDAYHQLLRLPAAKLKGEEKELKAMLKIGKAILVKEFSKTKQHKTIRELLDSEARYWIEIITPIWLSTPAQVANSFPMESNLFECVIFDEASQIPLANALGSLQRATQAIVAGDEQQMSPSNYFSGNSTNVDLLHQASYHWPKTALKHHYRSMHPELIAFSNRFFYHNELIAYPSAERSGQPLNFHFVGNGIYDGRQNTEEAKAAAQQIELLINHPDSIGIVAFSEQQLDCIWKQLSAETQNTLLQRTETHTAFFKALEQVQGDECDHLVVSLGYGKNPDGDFHLRFGPLNRKSGSKRLNVLLSRAKRSIHFFTSIKAYDLPVSTNEAVNLLRFFLSHEEQQKEEEILFPFDLQPVVKGNILEFKNLEQTLPDAEELVVLQSVLKNRGWELRFY